MIQQVYTEKTVVTQADICILVFIVALFTAAKR